MPQREPAIRSVCHRPGALGLRLSIRGLRQLQRLLEEHSFWARGRSLRQLRVMLSASQAVVTLWHGRDLVGFGRASSDRVFRAVLWDVVVAASYQGQGLGRRVVEELLGSPSVRAVQRVYLMTTNSSEFYRHLGFDDRHQQKLLLWEEGQVGTGD